MATQKNPNNRGQCPFYVIPTDPLSATNSITHCVSCTSENNRHLSNIQEDLRQIAFLTIIEETPKYNPNHPSGASYTTFIKAKVCTKLWQEKEKILRDMPYSHQEDFDDEDHQNNPLLKQLIQEACVVEQMADNVIKKIEVEFLRKHLPKLLKKLSDKERKVIEMKFFEETTGVKIAQSLNISQGRVTQLTQNALAKLGKAYLNALDTQQGNPYREIKD